MDRHAMHRLLEIEAKRVLGCQDPADLPRLACEAMEDGIDCGAIVELAGMEHPTWTDAEEAWARACGELGLRQIGRAEALDVVVLPQAQALAESFIRVRQPAAEVLHGFETLNERYGHPDFLADFCRLRSEWDYAGERADSAELTTIEQELRVACESLMNLRPAPRV